MVSTKVRSLMRKNEELSKSREKVALRVKRFNAMIRVVKENVRKQLLKEARADMVATKMKKKKEKRKCIDGRGRSERWPNRCWQCCHKHHGGKGGVMHQHHLCKATKRWLDRQ